MKSLLFNTHDIILLATIYQSLLFALLMIVVSRRRHKSDKYFVGFLITQAFIPLHLLINYGEAFKFVALETSPNLYRIFEVAYWLEGPLLLWYTRALVYKNFSLKPKDTLFLVPAAVYLVWMFASFFTQSYEVRYALMQNYQYLESSIGRHLAGFAREILRVAFGILCVLELRRCQQKLRDHYANLEEVSFGWLMFLVSGFLTIRVWAVLVAIALVVSAHTSFSVNVELMGLSGNYITFVLVSSLIFFSLTRSKIFEGIEMSSSDKTFQQEANNIDTELLAKLEQHMFSDKPYLHHGLTLERLSEQLSASPRALSNTINRHYQYNFFEFINRYRIEEAKRLLESAEKEVKPIQEVMSQSGFNSKATFNTFFKKVVGLTPSAYRKQCAIQRFF